MGLIPAWAGKTWSSQLALSKLSAHPRVGGENLINAGKNLIQGGSSPRGRGKLKAAFDTIAEKGLIPAWAGKTPTTGRSCLSWRAHPRVGGENGNGPTAGNPMYGSSPRGRGKLAVVGVPFSRVGLIPAWAGKTHWPTRELVYSGAHPRVGGENLTTFRRKAVMSWLIPAWAGKTRYVATVSHIPRAHPRVGGENVRRRTRRRAVRGSSPRGRGKPRGSLFSVIVGRLIPAWAGKTIGWAFRTGACRAHPRVGGENAAPMSHLGGGGGSSPRGRGKLVGRVDGHPDHGLIPAWAGKTQSHISLGA